jgi:hypothetical protein
MKHDVEEIFITDGAEVLQRRMARNIHTKEFLYVDDVRVLLEMEFELSKEERKASKLTLREFLKERNEFEDLVTDLYDSWFYNSYLYTLEELIDEKNKAFRDLIEKHKSFGADIEFSSAYLLDIADELRDIAYKDYSNNQDTMNEMILNKPLSKFA